MCGFHPIAKWEDHAIPFTTSDPSENDTLSTISTVIYTPTSSTTPSLYELQGNEEEDKDKAPRIGDIWLEKGGVSVSYAFVSEARKALWGVGGSGGG